MSFSQTARQLINISSEPRSIRDLIEINRPILNAKPEAPTYLIHRIVLSQANLEAVYAARPFDKNNLVRKWVSKLRSCQHDGQPPQIRGLDLDAGDANPVPLRTVKVTVPAMPVVSLDAEVPLHRPADREVDGISSPQTAAHAVASGTTVPKKLSPEAVLAIVRRARNMTIKVKVAPPSARPLVLLDQAPPQVLPHQEDTTPVFAISNDQGGQTKKTKKKRKGKSKKQAANTNAGPPKLPPTRLRTPPSCPEPHRYQPSIRSIDHYSPPRYNRTGDHYRPSQPYHNRYSHPESQVARNARNARERPREYGWWTHDDRDLGRYPDSSLGKRGWSTSRESDHGPSDALLERRVESLGKRRRVEEVPDSSDARKPNDEASRTEQPRDITREDNHVKGENCGCDHLSGVKLEIKEEDNKEWVKLEFKEEPMEVGFKVEVKDEAMEPEIKLEPKTNEERRMFEYYHSLA